MTLAAETTTSGPYACNGITTAFTVSFPFLEDSHLDVYKIEVATGDATLLTITTDYTVTGAGGASGTVTTTSSYSSAYQIYIVREVDYLQETDLQNQATYYPEVLEDALDKCTMQAQQLNRKVNKSFRLADSDTSGASTELPAPEANQIIGWNTTGTALANYSSVDLTTVAAYGSVACETFLGDGVETAFTLAASPGSLNNLRVSVDGAWKFPTIDFTWDGSTGLNFVAAPAAPAVPLQHNILVYYNQALPNGVGTATNVLTYQDGTGAIARDVEDKCNDIFSVLDFGADNTGTSDATAACQAAIDACELNGRGRVYFPAGQYKLVSGLTVNSNNIYLVGDGQTCTDLISYHVTADTITFTHVSPGASSLNYIKNIGLSGLRITSGVANKTAGAAVKIIRGASVRLTDVDLIEHYHDLHVVGGINHFYNGCAFSSGNVIAGALASSACIHIEPYYSLGATYPYELPQILTFSNFHIGAADVIESCIKITAGDVIYFNNGDIGASKTQHLYMTGYNYGGASSVINSVHFNQVYFDGGTIPGSPTGINVVDNGISLVNKFNMIDFVGCTFGQLDNAVLWAEDQVNHVAFVGCDFNNMRDIAVKITAGHSGNFRFNSCNFRDSSYVTGTYGGISCVNAKLLSVTGCQFTSRYGSAPEWVTATAYVTGNYAVKIIADPVSGDLDYVVVYVCKHDHTSGALTEPGVGANWTDEWTLVTYKTSVKPWVTARAYSRGDYRTNGGARYVCDVAHTSGGASEPGAGGSWEDYWTVISSQAAINVNGYIGQANITGNVFSDQIYDIVNGSTGAGEYITDYVASGNTTNNTAYDMSWSPTVAFDGGTTGVTYTTRVGMLERVGKMVFVTIFVKLLSKGAYTTETLTISLPSTITINGSSAASLNLYATALTAGVGDTMLMASVVPADKTVKIWKMAAGTATALVANDLTDASDFRVTGHYFAAL